MLEIGTRTSAFTLLDQPVSNCGRLKALIADKAEERCSFELDIQVLKDVDQELYTKDRVISSDSIILDHCISWENLVAECMERKINIRFWSGRNKKSAGYYTSGGFVIL